MIQFHSYVVGRRVMISNIQPGSQPAHSRIHLNRSSGVPLNLQLERHLEYLICAGLYREGELLPSIRALASYLHVSPGTIRRTYARLTERGLVRPHQGRGVAVTWHRVAGEKRTVDIELREILENPIRRARLLGFSNEQVVRGVLDMIAGLDGKIRAVFVGFNDYVARRYAMLLEDEFREFSLSVTPIDLPSLKKRLPEVVPGILPAPFVITQLYHLAEVEGLLNGINSTVIPVVVTLSRGSHEKLAALRISGKIGVVYPESMAAATLDAIATYLPSRKQVIYATPNDPARLRRIHASCQVVITNGIDEEEGRKLLGPTMQIIPLIYVPTLESLNRLRMAFSRSFVQQIESLPSAAAVGEP